MFAPWSLSSGRPRSDGPSRLRLRRSEKSGEQGSYVPRSERRGVRVGSRARGRPSDWRGRPKAVGARSECFGRIGGPKWLMSGRCSSWARPSGQLLDRPFALLFLDSQVELWHGSRSPRDPGFMNPTRAPEPPSDLSRIIREFLSCWRVRASAPVGVAPEPPGGSGGTGWGFFVLCLWVRVF